MHVGAIFFDARIITNGDFGCFFIHIYIISLDLSYCKPKVSGRHRGIERARAVGCFLRKQNGEPEAQELYGEVFAKVFSTFFYSFWATVLTF